MTKDDQDALATVTKAMTEVALEPFMNVAVPFTKELGELLALPITLCRFKVKIIIMEKANEFLRKRGKTPQQVPMKLLAPILEYGSLEDDESMQDRWASLLASAADQSFNNRILPSFASILKELSPVEAMILDRIYGTLIQNNHMILAGWVWDNAIIDVAESFADIQISPAQKIAIFENLERLALIRKFKRLDLTSKIEDFHPTHFGYNFIEACFVERKNLGRIVFHNGPLAYDFGSSNTAPATNP